MLKLKLRHFGHLIQTANSVEKTLMLGKIEGRRRRGQQRMRWLAGITDAMDMSLGQGDGEGQGSLTCCGPRGLKESERAWQLNKFKPVPVVLPVGTLRPGKGQRPHPTSPGRSAAEPGVEPRVGI